MVNYTRKKMDARFGFKESKRKSIIRANVKKYDELIAEASYLYQVRLYLSQSDTIN